LRAEEDQAGLHRVTRVWRIAASALVAVSAAGAAGVPAASAAATRDGDLLKLSDEHKLSRWAYGQQTAKVRAKPSQSAKTVGKIRLLTPDGFPQPYLLLSRLIKPDGETWVHIRLTGRPNGASGWVRPDALGPWEKVRWKILIERRAKRLTLYRSGKRVMRVRIGVGKSSTPTPAGRFWVTERFKVRSAPVYGPFAIGTSAYAPQLTDWPGGGVVGMHGTNQPYLIPGAPSHGCIRLKNRDIKRLYKRITIGTPIRIV